MIMRHDDRENSHVSYFIVFVSGCELLHQSINDGHSYDHSGQCGHKLLKPYLRKGL